MRTLTKYAPEAGMCHLHGDQFVARMIAYPPHRHDPKSPIRRDLWCLELKLMCGCSNHWGCKNLWIDDSLRMVMEGLSANNEIAQNWEDAKEATQ